MLSINTNLSSFITQSSMKNSTNILNQAIERMTTGFKINHAKDNAANYSISTNMTTKINSYMVAEDNTASALDFISTAEGILDQIDDKVQRVRALQEQVANGTYGEQSLKAINAEVNALVDEIERLYSTAEYNGIKIFSANSSNGTNGSGGTNGSISGDFINPITQRDTSTMIQMASVDETQILAVGTYSISSADDLQKLATITNNGLLSAGSEFVLANDIDMSGVTDWVAIGIYDDGTGNILPVSLDFDGNGHIIKNFTIEEMVVDINDECFSLFGHLQDSTIKNLAMENVNMDLDSATAENLAIAAPMMFTGVNTNIINCYTTGEIKMSSNLCSYGACGLALGVQGGNIENCFSSIDIILDYEEGGYAAGIVGLLLDGQVNNCEYSGNIAASSGQIGGIAMQAQNSSISNTTMLGTITISESITDQIGIFAGYTDNLMIKDCQYNSANTMELVGVATIGKATVTNVTPIAAPTVASYSLRSATPTNGFINAITQRDTSSMTKLSSVGSVTAISSGTYSISTAAELAQLATMTNANLITGGEFVLANDIDLSGYSNWTMIGIDSSNGFTGVFDGNGYVVSNLTMNGNDGGLFGAIKNATIKNLGVENVNITGVTDSGGGIVYCATNSLIDNCYATGTVSGDEGNAFVGGVLGGAAVGYADIQNCWADVDVSARIAGGLVGVTYYGSVNINNSFAMGDVIGSDYAGGLVGLQQGFCEDTSSVGMVTRVTNSGFYGTVKGMGTATVTSLLACAYGDIYSTSVSNCYYDSTLNPSVPALANADPSGTNYTPSSAAVGKTTAQMEAMKPKLYDYPSTPSGSGSSGGNAGGSGGTSSPSVPNTPSINYQPAGAISFQIGIGGNSASQISLDASFALNGIEGLRNIGLDNVNYFNQIDALLNSISAKQTEYGAVSNRLESVLEEIQIQYENLVSSRSTIRDADIAKESASYIQAQILQQAAATLMSTANQSPAIALQLI